MLIEREILDKKFSARVTLASLLITPKQGLRNECSTAKYQRKADNIASTYVHTTFLSSKFLPFSEMCAVNKKVLKPSTDFFRRTFFTVKLITYVHVFRIPYSTK